MSLGAHCTSRGWRKKKLSDSGLDVREKKLALGRIAERAAAVYVLGGIADIPQLYRDLVHVVSFF